MMRERTVTDIDVRLTRRRRGVVLAIATFVSAAASQIGVWTTDAATVIPGSCYDFLFYDGLDSRYAANHCAGALNAAGYAGTAYHNVAATTALANAQSDAVFFHAGHSLDFFENNCQPTCTGAHTGVAMAFESPDQNGNLDALASDPITAADLTNAFVQVCSEGGGCKNQLVMTAYPWGDDPALIKDNLIVLESCATAQDTTSFTSLARTAYDSGAGTVVGFVDDVSFSVNADESNLYGDAWANTFWSDAQSGVAYTTSVVDASNAVGNQYGYGSYVILINPGAPSSLYPAQYFLF
jgi:hypothetical protein